MSLARGEEALHETTPASSRPPKAVVIAIAYSLEERLRVASLFGDHVSVLLVSSREEAVALLTAEDPPGTARPESPERPGSSDCGLLIDSDRRTATWRDRAVPLSPLEHDALRCLLSDVGRTWTFEELHQDVWGNDHLGDRSDMQSVVKRLRRKLGFLDAPLQVQAIRGVGFRLVRAAAAVDEGRAHVSERP
ncbi:winged helix-turn-helix domain-containing protein [Nocardioides campestrisoli]|uniref:winged helix-turn-helix domain-containing protein n=1 Tax=Nocardioides campestrisoli TaxID=2736757 RepID=UPI00163DC85D|nr:winged helix-turn-helix domain-containing protein [Nocardioides campestrisoli]